MTNWETKLLSKMEGADKLVRKYASEHPGTSELKAAVLLLIAEIEMGHEEEEVPTTWDRRIIKIPNDQAQAFKT